MATLTPQQITHAGLAWSYASAESGGDKFRPGQNMLLIIHNDGAGGNRTVTVDSPRACSQGGSHDDVLVVADDTVEIAGPYPADRWAAASDGLVAVTYDNHANVEIAAVYF